MENSFFILLLMKSSNTIIAAFVALFCGCTTTSSDIDGQGGDSRVQWVHNCIISDYLVATDSITFDPKGITKHIVEHTNPYLNSIDFVLSHNIVDAGQKAEFQRQLNDYNYSGKYFKRECYVNSFTGVDIYSDTEFNGIAPGKSIASKVKLFALSPYKWLTSKQTVSYDWNNSPIDVNNILGNERKYEYLTELIPQNHPVFKFISDIDASDLRYLNADFVFLYFPETPDNKEHTFTLVFKEGEKEYKGSYFMTFK